MTIELRDLAIALMRKKGSNNMYIDQFLDILIETIFELKAEKEIEDINNDN